MFSTVSAFPAKQDISLFWAWLGSPFQALAERWLSIEVAKSNPDETVVEGPKIFSIPAQIEKDTFLESNFVSFRASSLERSDRVNRSAGPVQNGFTIALSHGNVLLVGLCYFWLIGLVIVPDRMRGTENIRDLEAGIEYVYI